MMDEIEQLTREIINGAKDVNELTLEQAEGVRKRINPLSNISTSNTKSYANLSIFNWRDHYIRKLHTTGLIGYMYRAANECDLPAKKKQIIKRFLASIFEFDPERHIRVSTNKVNSSAPVILPNTEVQSAPDAALAYQALTTSINVIKNAIPYNNVDDAGILTKQLDELEQQRAKFAAASKSYLEESADTMNSVATPAELFYNYERYFESNFEQIRAIVEEKYHEKPDIEFSIIYHDSFKSKKDSDKHIAKYGNDFSTDVIGVENNGITLLGPFKENRERLGFYTKNTEVLKAMMEQQTADAALGKDLMKKRIKNAKRKNIEEAGLDAEGLKLYQNSIGTIDKLTSKGSLSTAEREELDKAIYTKKQLEVPEGAIAVEAFYTEQNENGETLMKKTEFYTKEEEPLHLQKDSKFANQYQPDQN